MVQVKDLKEQIGMNGPRPILYCNVCGAQYSANAGDYWNRPGNTELLCCDEPMQLVIKKIIFEPIQ